MQWQKYIERIRRVYIIHAYRIKVCDSTICLGKTINTYSLINLLCRNYISRAWNVVITLRSEIEHSST